MRGLSGLQHLLAFLTELLQTCQRLTGIGLGGDHRGGPGAGGRKDRLLGRERRIDPQPARPQVVHDRLAVFRDDGLAEQVFRFARGRLRVGFEVKHDLGIAIRDRDRLCGRLVGQADERQLRRAGKVG